MSEEKGVFISYRRESGAAEARIIEGFLSANGFDVFLDVDMLGAGHFDDQLLRQIETRRHFILICSPGSLERCANEGDWVRREVAHALKTGRNLVPVQTGQFRWPEPESLPEDIRALQLHNAFRYDHLHWKDTRPRLLRMLGGPSSSSPVQSDATASARVSRAEVQLQQFKGWLDELKRAADGDSNQRQALLRQMLVRTSSLPKDPKTRRDFVLKRAELALELDDRDIGRGMAQSLRNLPALPGDRPGDLLQQRLLTRFEARGWLEESQTETPPATPGPFLPELPPAIAAALPPRLAAEFSRRLVVPDPTKGQPSPGSSPTRASAGTSDPRIAANPSSRNAGDLRPTSQGGGSSGCLTAWITWIGLATGLVLSRRNGSRS